jgi:hypothetical protein
MSPTNPALSALERATVAQSRTTVRDKQEQVASACEKRINTQQTLIAFLYQTIVC